MAERKRENTVNFAPGPAALPDEVRYCNPRDVTYLISMHFLSPPPSLYPQVLREAQENAWNYKGMGLGVMGKL